MAVNYAQFLTGQESPLDKSLKMYQMGSSIQQNKERQNVMKFNRQQAEEQNAQTRQMQTDLYNLSQRKNAGAEEYVAMMVKYPELSSHLKRAYELLNEDQKTNAKRNALPVLMSLEFGDVEGAKQMLNIQKNAATESGLEDQANASDALLKMMEINPDSVKTTLALSMASSMNEKDYFELYGKINDEKRKRGLYPLDVEKTEAEIEGIETGTELKETQIAKTAAEKRKIWQETIKVGKDMGLKDSQIAKVKKETEKLSNDIKKQVMEMEAAESGDTPITSENRFKWEQSLRKEYSSNTKDVSKVREAYRRIKAVDPTAAGDLALIFNYMKMLDPGSVVRESEYATAENSAGVPERIRRQYNKIIDGQKLGKIQRADFKKQASNLYSASLKTEKEVRGKLQKISKQYDLNPDNIFFMEPEQAKETAEAPAAQAQTVTDEELLLLE